MTWQPVYAPEKVRFQPIDPIDGACVIIWDYKFWVHKEAEILKWLKESSIEYRMDGIVMTFKDSLDRSAFLLRWR